MCWGRRASGGPVFLGSERDITRATATRLQRINHGGPFSIYENPLHMLGHCRHYRRAVAARVDLAATLSADGAAPDVYGTVRAAIAVVLRAVEQVPHC
jgi:hypothetical protein